jgi:hypothetical protein
MPEASWGPVLLGLITLVLLIQTAVLITLALAARRLLARARTLEDEIRSGVVPSLARLGRVAENAEEISDRLVRGLPHLEGAVADAAENIQRANRIFEGLEGLLSLPLRPIARGLAFLRGVRRSESERSRPALPSPPTRP